MGKNALRLVSNSESQNRGVRARDGGVTTHRRRRAAVRGDGRGQDVYGARDRDWCRVGGFGPKPDVHHCG